MPRTPEEAGDFHFIGILKHGPQQSYFVNSYDGDNVLVNDNGRTHVPSVSQYWLSRVGRAHPRKRYNPACFSPSHLRITECRKDDPQVDTTDHVDDESSAGTSTTSARGLWSARSREALIAKLVRDEALAQRTVTISIAPKLFRTEATRSGELRQAAIRIKGFNDEQARDV